METLTLQGRRWGSVGAVVLTAPISVLLVGLVLHLIARGDFGKAGLAAAAAAVMLRETVNLALTVARPNRLILSSEGLTLATAHQSRSWSWEQFAGLHGWWHRMLIVHERPRRERRIAIGHWQPDLGRAIADYARRVGHEVPPGSAAEMPSPAPLFLASGLLAMAALAVALFR